MHIKATFSERWDFWTGAVFLECFGGTEHAAACGNPGLRNKTTNNNRTKVESSQRGQATKESLWRCDTILKHTRTHTQAAANNPEQSATGTLQPKALWPTGWRSWKTQWKGHQVRPSGARVGSKNVGREKVLCEISGRWRGNHLLF